MLISHKISFKLNALFIKDTLTRSGAAAARQAHNLEVGGSNPPSATRLLTSDRATGLVGPERGRTFKGKGFPKGENLGCPLSKNLAG